VAIDENRRRWSEWVDARIGGDAWRRRTAFDAAMQALQLGATADQAAAAAVAAVVAQPQGPVVVRCRFCGSVPAVPMTIYEHNGFVLMMQFKNLRGPFCRSCGLHVWRRMTDTTLLRGWLGFMSFFIAPATALVNVVNLPKLSGLPPPQPGSGVRPPSDPGGGLFTRPGVYVYGGVILVVVLFLLLPALRGR
jgi:hypothetical protein